MSVRKRLAAVLWAGVLVACSDQSPPSAPGTVTAELRSPNGAEGAAVLSLHGEGIGAVTAWGDTEAHAWPDSAGVRIVLVHATGGSLSFRVALADTTEPPSFSIEEVAAPDDQLRTALGAYTLEFGR